MTEIFICKQWLEIYFDCENIDRPLFIASRSLSDIHVTQAHFKKSWTVLATTVILHSSKQNNVG